MKKALKIAAVMNALLAALAFWGFDATVYPIILIILAIIYLSLSETNYHEKQPQLIILAIISLFMNFVSGIAILVGLDKMKDETPQETPQLSKEEKKTVTLLNLGVGLVGLSGIILATTNWNIMSDAIKISLLLGIGIMFLILSIISEKTLKIEILAKNYWLLSMLFIILTVIANGYLEIISHWMSFNGEGHYLYTALTAIVTSLLALITYNKYNKKIYKNISYIGIIAALAAILLHFEVEMCIILIIVNAVLLLANIIKNEEIKNISRFLTYIAAVLGIIYMADASCLIIGLILAAVVLINLIIITIKATALESIIIPILVHILILVAMTCVQTELELSSQMVPLILAAIYSILYLLNLLKKENINKPFKVTMNILTNTMFACLLLANTDDKLILTYISALVALTSLLNYSKNTIKAEKIMLPIKLIIFIVSTIELLRETINIDKVYILIGAYILTYAVYKLIKNKKIETISLVIYYILFALAIAQTTLAIPAAINIAFAFIVLILSGKESITKQRLSYIALLIAIATTFAYTNPLALTQLENGLIILLVYLIFTIINCKNKSLNKISYLSIILPLSIITSDPNLDFEVTQIAQNIVGLYAILLLNIFLVKENKDRNILSAVLIALLLLQVIFTESWMIGIYVGIVALALIIIGFTKKEFKGLYIEGIVITVVNLLFQFKYIFEELPLWLYTLLAGLIIIGLVTYKIIKDNEK